MTGIKDELVSEYHKGLRDGENSEGQRRLGMSILNHALASGVLTVEPENVVRRTLQAMEIGQISEREIKGLSDELHDYLVRKNGRSVVLRDREDKVIRATFEAFYSTIDYDGIDTVAHETEQLLTSDTADIQ